VAGVQVMNDASSPMIFTFLNAGQGKKEETVSIEDEN
jgi:hypothetical protein